MKLFTRFLCLLALALPAFVVSAHAAQTVAIIDNLASSTSGSVAQHDPIGHWEGFSTTLSASVNYPPPPISETKIVGPTFIWSGGTSQIQRSSNQGQTISLQSVFPPTAALPAGENSITINCSATYQRKNSDDQVIEVISVPASSITVKFWSRVPEKVVSNGPKSQTVFTGELAWDTTDPDHPFADYTWGVLARYPLQIHDNQGSDPNVGTAQGYGYGLPREEFTGYNPNGVKGAFTFNLNPSNTWDQSPAVPYDGTGSPTYNFVDTVGKIQHSQPDVVAPATDWQHTLIGSSDQTWHCMELKPPYAPAPPGNLYITPGRFGRGGTETPNRNPSGSDFLSNVADTELNTHHLDIYWGNVLRSYAGIAPY